MVYCPQILVNNMNYFFFVAKDDISAKLTVPRFQNSGSTRLDLDLYGARALGNKWMFYEAVCDKGVEFWTIEQTGENLNDIFFLCTKEEFDQQCASTSQLLFMNDFTKTDPHFRANLQVSCSKGGFSSYQSDYPFGMTSGKGDVVSNVYSVGNITGVDNGIFYRNIFHLPIKQSFNAYLINSMESLIVEKFTLTTNACNYIDLTNKRISSHDYIFCKGFLGIPIYFSRASSGMLSLEHTHPPHDAVSRNVSKSIVNDYKERIGAPIYQQNA